MGSLLGLKYKTIWGKVSKNSCGAPNMTNIFKYIKPIKCIPDKF